MVPRMWTACPRAGTRDRCCWSTVGRAGGRGPSEHGLGSCPPDGTCPQAQLENFWSREGKSVTFFPSSLLPSLSCLFYMLAIVLESVAWLITHALPQMLLSLSSSPAGWGTFYQPCLRSALAWGRCLLAGPSLLEVLCREHQREKQQCASIAFPATCPAKPSISFRPRGLHSSHGDSYKIA